MLLFSLILFGSSWLHPNLSWVYVAERMLVNAQRILEGSVRQGTVSFFDHENPILWAGINFPWAVLTGLYRPNVGDWGSALQNLVVMEYLLLLIFSLGRLSSLNKRQLVQSDWLACMVYVIILAGLLTLSTPNFGTLVRFKASFLPVFVFMILHNNKWWLWICSRVG